MLWLDIIGGKLKDVFLNRGNTKYCVKKLKFSFDKRKYPIGNTRFILGDYDN